MRHHAFSIVLSPLRALPDAALDLPPRKARLWELKTTHEDSQMPPQFIQQCIDAATDKLMGDKFGGQDVCPNQEINKSGDGIVAEPNCKIGDVATTTRAVYDGYFNSAYTVKISSTKRQRRIASAK